MSTKIVTRFVDATASVENGMSVRKSVANELDTFSKKKKVGERRHEFTLANRKYVLEAGPSPGKDILKDLETNESVQFKEVTDTLTPRRVRSKNGVLLPMVETDVYKGFREVLQKSSSKNLNPQQLDTIAKKMANEVVDLLVRVQRTRPLRTTRQKQK